MNYDGNDCRTSMKLPTHEKYPENREFVTLNNALESLD